jgi:F-type H+-transporting ATPase subunit epsilon
MASERSFTVDIVTPERVVLSDRAVALQAPGVCGSFGVLPNHAPLLSELQVGELRFRKESGQEVRLAVSGGFLQVFDNKITVLADTAERADEIDPDRARQALEKAKNELAQAQAMNYDLVQKEIARAQNRLRIAGGG